MINNDFIAEILSLINLKQTPESQIKKKSMVSIKYSRKIFLNFYEQTLSWSYLIFCSIAHTSKISSYEKYELSNHLLDCLQAYLTLGREYFAIFLHQFLYLDWLHAHFCTR